MVGGASDQFVEQQQQYDTCTGSPRGTWADLKFRGDLHSFNLHRSRQRLCNPCKHTHLALFLFCACLSVRLSSDSTAGQMLTARLFTDLREGKVSKCGRESPDTRDGVSVDHFCGSGLWLFRVRPCCFGELLTACFQPAFCIIAEGRVR